MSPRPFANLDRRTVWLRSTLLISTLLGLVASAPVWSNSRNFPLLPIVPGFPVLTPPADQLLFGGLLVSLIAGFWFYKLATITFLTASFFAYCGDQNRGQPWLYMYWAMLLFSLFPEKPALAGARFSLTILYFWAGAQKLNDRFFSITPEWFIAPAEQQWHWPMALVDLAKMAVKASPLVEIASALLLWIKPLRRVALGLILATHGFALLFLGPWGHNYNWVVWPWNLAMITLAFALFSEARWFAGNPSSNAATKVSTLQFQRNLTLLRDTKSLALLVALYGMLPCLSFVGRWDSYFSFALYSENLAVANVFCTDAFRDRLPAPLRRYVEPFPQAFDPQRQGPFLFVFPKWAYDELNVPTVSEPRNFLELYEALLPYAQKPEDLRIIIGPRHGPVIFREGARTELLQRSD